MSNSNFRPITIHQPARLEVGPDTISKVHDVVRSKTVLVVTAQPVAGHVERLGITGNVRVYMDTPAEPDEIALEEILKIAAELKPDVVVGLGGGSVMDLAKLVSVMWDRKQSLSDIIGPNNVANKLSYLIQIPTTAGTGSEAGIRALVTNSKNSSKMAVESPLMRADLAILDPTLTASVPSAVTAATGVDAMAHCVEAFTNINAHNMIDDYARMGMKLVGKYIERAVNNGDDLEAREGMMLASYYGGICLGPVNTAAGHALAYPLSTQLHLPHGLANALIFPHVLSFNAAACPVKTKEVLEALGLDTNVDGTGVFDQAYAFCKRLGIDMSLREHGAEEAGLEGMAAEAYSIRRLMDNNPSPMSQADILKIYQTAYS